MSEIMTVEQLRQLVERIEDLPPHAEIEITGVWQEFYAERLARVPDGTYLWLGPCAASVREAYLEGRGG